jgi:hypothetical protein
MMERTFRGGLVSVSICIAGAAVFGVISGCGSSATGDGVTSETKVLSTAESKRLLLELPYRYRWSEVEPPKGASGALAGTAIGKHRTVLHFGISLGTSAEAVAVPQAGMRNPYSYSRGGFVFNDDIIIPGGVGKQIHSAAQWREANFMEVKMEEKLCKAATGEACPP